MRKTLSKWFKPVEMAGRYALELVVGVLLWSRRQPIVQLPAAAKILVVRLDQRVGNLLLLTPLLGSLKQSFPLSHITLLCHEKVDQVVAGQPFVDAREHYVKWQLFSRRGPFALVARLRRAKFDVAIDAGSFDTASITHPVLTRLSGARATIGMNRPRVGRLYSVRVALPLGAEHEIAQRLRLLSGVSLGQRRVSDMTYVTASRLAALRREHAAFVTAAAPEASNTLLFVVGGRLAERQLTTEEWAALGHAAVARGRAVTLLFGPGERSQAEALRALLPEARLAPDSTLDQVAALAVSVRGVIGHDTGTSHLAAAVGARLLVVFVATDPVRYGHKGIGQTWVDVRSASPRLPVLLHALQAWDQEG